MWVGDKSCVKVREMSSDLSNYFEAGIGRAAEFQSTPGILLCRLLVPLADTHCGAWPGFSESQDCALRTTPPQAAMPNISIWPAGSAIPGPPTDFPEADSGSHKIAQKLFAHH
jgi:hypothetical protein